MRFVIHLGTFKTGSSAIQHALAEGSDRLEATGFHYVATGRRARFEKHLDLYDHLVDDGTNSDRHQAVAGRDLEGELRAEMAAHPDRDFVFSEEELSHPSGAAAEFFGRFAGEVALVPVLVARRQDELLESLYRQWLRETARGITDPLADLLAQSDFLARGDFMHIAEPWQRACGAVRVLDFDALRDDLIPRFCAEVGLPRLASDAARNPSISAVEGEMIRQAAVACPNIKRNLVAELLSGRRGEPSHRTTVITPHDRERLVDHFAESNAKLADRFGVALDLGSSRRTVLNPGDLQVQAIALARQVVTDWSTRSTKSDAEHRRLRTTVDQLTSWLQSHDLAPD